MKKIFLLLILCLVAVGFFVNYTFRRVFDNTHGVSVKVKEKENVYELRASYRTRKTRMVQRFMDEKLHTNKFFRKSHMEADITTNEGLRLRVEMHPGYVFLRMKKDENDSAAYQLVKEITEGIKLRVTDDL